MRYKLTRNTILGKMAEYGQNKDQRAKYLRQTIATLFEKEDFTIFDIVAKGFLLYYMILNDCFDIIRLSYEDYFIIVQKQGNYLVFEIRKKETK